MTPPGPVVSEFDLLAYADGLLEPERRGEVEAYLRDHPEEARRVRAHARQNEAIRAALGGTAGEPVPGRLKAVLDKPHRAPARRMLQGVAALGIAAAAGLGGWLLGQGGEPREPAMRAFVADSLSIHAGAEAAGAPAGLRPLDWLSDRIWLNLRAPDLSAEGLALTDKALVTVRGRPAVRLIYRDARDRPATLLIRPRWADGPAPPRYTKDGGLTVAYGLSGPLAYALVGDMPRDRIATLTERVRRALRGSANDAAPGMKVTPAPRAQQAGTPASAPVNPPTIETLPTPARPLPVQAN